MNTELRDRRDAEELLFGLVADAMEMAADRHAEELAKADRRTAEQERIITKQHEKIEALRDALTEALDAWASEYEDRRTSRQPLEDPRIVELRKLTEGP